LTSIFIGVTEQQMWRSH